MYKVTRRWVVKPKRIKLKPVRADGEAGSTQVACTHSQHVMMMMMMMMIYLKPNFITKNVTS